jgi:predicted enzyme related to lactoylglutathione lyase
MDTAIKYQPGVPCWVDTVQQDVAGAVSFYQQLFGWNFIRSDRRSDGPRGEYFVARFFERDVAGIGSHHHNGAPSPAWNTYVSVASAEETAEKVKTAGGKIVAAPFDVPPAGRMAVLADPMGALFRIWEAGERKGAQLVDQPVAWSMSALNTGDQRGAEKFYSEVFRWEADTSLGTVTLWRLKGYVGGVPEQSMPRDVVAMMIPFTNKQAHEGVASHWRVTFWVNNPDTIASDTAKLGGKIITPAFDIPIFPGFRQAVLADPAGAMFLVVGDNRHTRPVT